MSLMELFRNYAKGNSGNSKVTAPVTATDHATQGGNSGNSGNSKNTTHRELIENIREQIEERAAIMEYDGGLTRNDAEQAATKAIRVYCYRVTDKPKSELVAIMPNTELEEATENLKNKYGERLIDVYPSPYCMAGILGNNTKH